MTEWLEACRPMMKGKFILEAAIDKDLEALNKIIESSSDDNNNQRHAQWGSVPCEAQNIERRHEKTASRLSNQKFSLTSIYIKKILSTWFRL